MGSPAPDACETAVVLAGAFAKGAYSAGVLDVVVRRGYRITRVVATSAGALNGVVLGAGLRAGKEIEAAERLCDLWSNVSWRDALDFSLRQILRRRGLATSHKLRRLLQTSIDGWLPGARNPVELLMVVTALRGDPRIQLVEGTTSFESSLRFDGACFDRPSTRPPIFAAAVASAAFPGLFAPVLVDDLGGCVDGGAVNNTPIRDALRGNPRIGRVIVVPTRPALHAPTGLRGLVLFEHLVEILINERLYRDLREARAVERRLRAMEALVAAGTVTAAQLDAVKAAMDLRDTRHIEVIEIRPRAPLRGAAIAGLFDRRLRQEYVEEGRRSAIAALDLRAAGPSEARRAGVAMSHQLR